MSTRAYRQSAAVIKATDKNVRTQKPAGTGEVDLLYHVDIDIETADQGEFKHS